MKSSRKQFKVILNYVIGPLLFIVLVLIIYSKIKNQSDLNEKLLIVKGIFTTQNILQLIFLFVLLCANWGIESRKWQLLMHPIERLVF